MAKKDEGKKYLEELLKLVPEDKRAAVQEALSVDAVLETVGDGVLMRSDYSRKQDELRKQAEETKAVVDRNTAWYAENAAGLANAAKWQRELEEAKAALKRQNAGDDGTTTTAAPPDLSAFVKREDAEAAMRQALGTSEAQFVDFATTLQNLSMKHFKDYGEILDTKDLVKKTFEMRKPLPDAYAEITRDLATKRQEKAEADRETAIRASEREKVRAEMSARGPYPMPDSSEPSTLSGLSGKSPEYGKDAALKDFWANKARAAS